ncbi:reverse transcriptase domain-containing protein [Tanacetum coccineum]
MSIELGEHDIEFKGHNFIKRQILDDFLAATPSVEDKDMKTKKPATTNKVSNSRSTWNLYTDKASSSDGFSDGLMLVSPEGKESANSRRNENRRPSHLHRLPAGAANQVKGLFKARQPVIEQFLEKTKEVLRSFDTYSMEHIRRNQNKMVDALSKLASMTFKYLIKEVLVEVLASRSINSKEVSKITVKTRKNWMTPIYEYLLSGPSQAKSIIREIYDGSCGFNAEPRSMVVKITKQGYYWPSMHRDTAEAIQECTRCQKYSTPARMPNHDVTVVKNAWPFNHWGSTSSDPYLRLREV